MRWQCQWSPRPLRPAANFQWEVDWAHPPHNMCQNIYPWSMTGCYMMLPACATATAVLHIFQAGQASPKFPIPGKTIPLSSMPSSISVVMTCKKIELSEDQAFCNAQKHWESGNVLFQNPVFFRTESHIPALTYFILLQLCGVVCREHIERANLVG